MPMSLNQKFARLVMILSISCAGSLVASPALAGPQSPSQLAARFEKPGDPEGVIKTLEPVRAKLPPDDLLRLARAYRAKKDAQAEIMTLELVLAKRPKDVGVLTRLAEAHSLAGHKDEAIERFQEAIKLSPKDSGALTGLAREFEIAGDFYEARAVVEDLVKFQGPNDQTRSWLCRLYSREHLLEKSVEACRQSIEANPHVGDDYLFLATSLRDLSRPEQALSSLAKAQRKFPRLEPAFTLEGEIQLGEKRAAAAYAAFKKALAINSRSVKANLGFAETAMRLEKLGEALAAFERVCTFDKSASREFRAALYKLRAQHNSEWELKFEKGLDSCQ